MTIFSIVLAPIAIMSLRLLVEGLQEVGEDMKGNFFRKESASYMERIRPHT